MSISKAQEHRRKAVEAAKRAQGFLDVAAAEKRERTAEELASFDAAMAEHDTELRTAQDLERVVDAEQRRQLAEKDATDPLPVGGDQGAPSGVIASEAYRNAYWRCFRYGMEDLTPEERGVLQGGKAEITPEMRQSMRAMGSGTIGGGGFALPGPSQARLIEAEREFNSLEAFGATVLTTDDGNEIPFSLVNETTIYGRRLGESKASAQLNPVSGKKLSLKAYIYTSDEITVPIPLLTDPGVDMEGWILRLIGERLARIQNREFTVGDGGSMPQGIVTAAHVGRQAATGQATTITKGDELVYLQSSLSAAYQPGARWLLHPSSLRDIRMLKDGQGRMLFESALDARTPATILGAPYVLNDEMPTMAASVKSILYGQGRYYHIRRVTDRVLFRLDQTAAKNFEVEFVAFERADGLLADAGTHPVVAWQNSAS